MGQIASFKELNVWKKSIELATKIYSVTAKFPPDEKYGITSQMKRASISVASNIAEGSIRGSRKEFVHFLRISSGSIAELQTQIEICKTLDFGCDINFTEIENLSVEINKMVHGLISKLKT